MSPPQIAFVGHVLPDSPEFLPPNWSRSGNLFEIDLVDSLNRAGVEIDLILSYRAARSWPAGPLFVKGGHAAVAGRAVTLLPFLNLTPFKQLTIGLLTLLKLLNWSFMRSRGHRKLVYCFNASVPPIGFLVAARWIARFKLVACINDINIPGETVPATPWARIDFAQHRYWLPKVDGLTVVTDAIARDFAPNRPCIVIEGGASAEVLEACAVKARRKCDRRRLVFAGALTEYNGVRLILGAFEILKARNVELIIAGAGPLRQEVTEAAARDGRIRYLGFIDRKAVLTLYAEADLLLNIRLTRAIATPYFFPGKLIEYLCTGVPTLSTKCAHVSRRFADILFLLDEETPEALAEAIGNVLAAPLGVLQDKGRKARTFMASRMTWEMQGRRIAAFFSELASSDAGAVHLGATKPTDR